MSQDRSRIPDSLLELTKDKSITDTNTLLDMSDETFTDSVKEGLMLAGVEDAKELIRIYCERNTARFVIKANDKKQLQFICHLGWDRKSKAKTKKSESKSTKCPAKITFSKSKRLNALVIIRILETHNHDEDYGLDRNIKESKRIKKH